MINWKNDREELRRLYVEEGLNQTELGDMFGCTQRQMSNILKDLGIERTEEDKLKLRIKRNPSLVRKCQQCGKEFIAVDLKVGKFCSRECAAKFHSKVPEKETLLKQLEDDNWNYSAVGRLNGVSDNAIIKKLRSFGLYETKQYDWSDVVDLESAQKKVEELGLNTAKDLHENYGGLADRLGRLGILTSLVYPGTDSEFDSSWEENIYNFIYDNENMLGISKLSHNKILSEDCKDIKPLIFDIILEYDNPNINTTVIEIQGPTHFKDVYNDNRYVSTMLHDEIKYNYCITHDINILYFTYEKSLIEKYEYPHYVYTDENLLLEKLKEFSLPSST